MSTQYHDARPLTRTPDGWPPPPCECGWQQTSWLSPRDRSHCQKCGRPHPEWDAERAYNEVIAEADAKRTPVKPRIIHHAGNHDISLEVKEVGRWRYGSRSEIAIAYGNGAWYVGDLIDELLYSPNMYGDYVTAKRYFDECVRGDR